MQENDFLLRVFIGRVSNSISVCAISFYEVGLTTLAFIGTNLSFERQ